MKYPVFDVNWQPTFEVNKQSDYTKKYYDDCLLDCINGTYDCNNNIIRLINFNVKKTHIIYFHNFSYLLANLEQLKRE
jgi:hypothetical protein